MSERRTRKDMPVIDSASSSIYCEVIVSSFVLVVCFV